MYVTIGIDPGRDGGVAVLGLNLGPLVMALPYTEKEPNTARLFEFVKSLIGPMDDVFVLIEKVHAMPGQGVSSMFTFGSGFGEIKAFAKILGRPWGLVTPQAWKKSILAGTDKSKGATIEWAHRSYPSIVTDLTKASGLAHLGKVDALAIAHYGHHFHKR